MPVRAVILRLFPAIAAVALTAWLAIKTGTSPDLHNVEVISGGIEEQVISIRRDLKKFASGQNPFGKETYVKFDQGIPVKWSTSIRFPLPLPPGHDTLIVRRSPAGIFLDVWYNVSPKVSVVGIIPLVCYYQLPGGKTIERHHPIFGKDPPILIFDSERAGRPVSVSKIILFSLIPQIEGGSIHGWSSWAWLFLSACALAWLIRLVYQVCRGFAVPFLTFSFLLLAAFRVFMLRYDLPGTSPEWPMFDSAVFASSAWSSNAINFLINQIFFLTFSLLVYAVAGQLPIRRLINEPYWKTYLLFVIISTAVVVGFHYPFLNLLTVVRDSVIPMDLTRSIQFTPTRIIVFIAIITAGASSSILLRLLLKFLSILVTKLFRQGYQYWIVLVFLFMFGLSWYIAGKTAWEQTACLFLLLLPLAVRITVLCKTGKRLSQGTSGMLQLFLLALGLALGIRSMEQSGLRDRMVVFARTLEEDRDEFGEYLLNELCLNIRKDAFIAMTAESPLSDKNRILRKLYQHHLVGYLAKFPSQAGFYNSDGTLVDGNTAPSLLELKHGARRISGTDSAGGVFLRSRSSTADGLSKSYLVLVPAGMGTIGLIVDMRPSVADKPWYFRLDDRGHENEMGSDLSYAIISNERIVFQSEADVYGNTHDSESRDQMQTDVGSQLMVRMTDGRMLRISGPDYSLGRLLTNFSFYLFVALVVMAIIRLWRIMIERINGRRLSYTARIQLYLALAFILPLLVTSIAAIRNVSLEGEGQVTAEHRKMVLALASEAGRQTGAEKLPERDQVIGAGILPADGFILYDLNGRRVFSNQPELLESSLMPQLMNPIALDRMRQGLSYTAIREEVAGYAYQGTYAVVKAGIPAEPVAWLHVPYFEHYASAEQTRIDVIISILPIAVLVFIVFWVVSNQMSERLTQPIRDVSKALRQGSLNGSNFRGGGQESDEIGKMTEAYHQMMAGLEQSKRELLASQRDADWRDMARQVAHEIRNPLTPIRLKLQWLQRQIKEGTVAPVQASASIEAILAQTDILSGIAGSFSALAGFPRLQPEEFDAVAETARTVDLFSEQSGGSIVLNKPDTPIMVVFDRPFFSRILSNLFLNAIQSTSGEVRVEVTIQTVDGHATITVKDNGEGIDPSLGDQIFLPRFTTKSGGSGLGLAIARQGLEHAGGRIWYQSVPGAGSEFHIAVKLAGLVSP